MTHSCNVTNCFICTPQVSGPDELLAKVRDWLSMNEAGYVIAHGITVGLLTNCERSIAANAALAARCGEDTARLDWLDGPDGSLQLVTRWAKDAKAKSYRDAIDLARAALASQENREETKSG